MSDLLNRLARALGEELYGHCDPDGTPNTWRTAMSLARTALREMREPDEAMIDAASQVESKEDGYFIGRDEAMSAWKISIAVALNEEPLHTSSDAVCPSPHRYDSTGRYCIECGWDVMAGFNPDCHARKHTSSEIGHG